MQKASRWLPIFTEFVSDLRIVSKSVTTDDPRGVPLELWDSQKIFLRELARGLDEGIRTFYVLKSRQLGITTVSLAIDCFWVAMNRNMKMAIVTESEANRESNRAIIKHYVESFPTNYFGDEFAILKDNRSFMSFTNGSRIDWLVAGTKNKGTSWGEGRGYTCVHATEVAGYGSEDGLDSFLESLSQTNDKRLYVLESTAKGFNHWKSRWESGLESLTARSLFCGWWSGAENRIERGDPRFAKFGHYAASGEERELIQQVKSLYDYTISPEQLAWIRWREDEDQRKGSDGSMLAQNQPWTASQAFVASGSSFFQTRAITLEMKRLDAMPEGLVSEGGCSFWGYRYEFGNSFFDMQLVSEDEDIDRVELRVWEPPVKGGRYAIGVDPAWGRNDWKDRNTVSVWRCYADKCVLVAEFASADCEVKQAAWVMAHLAGAYSSPTGDLIMNYEINGPGNVIKMEFDNLRGQLNSEMNTNLVREREWEDALSNARWYLYARPDAASRPSAIGFSTNFNNKSVLMHNFRGAFVTKELIIYSRPLLGEMNNVVQDGGSIGAPESRGENSKDDRVFAAALAIRAWLEWIRPGMIQEGLTYERVRQEESGETSAQVNRINDQVYRFFRRQEELANMEPDAGPKWRTDRGL